MSHEPGEVLLDRYLLEAAIGQGGMGAVYRALDQQTGLIVALKQLRADAGAAGFENDEMLKRFEGEWQLLLTLHHPRIPKMLDAFRIEDCGYYVMEFIEGQSLDGVLKGYKSSGRRFPEELLIQYALQILDVLDYLHGLPKPLLHRDVKPQNIIVREADRELFLVDFGLAREGGSATTKTLVGTLGYAPLEQVKGHPEPRSDLYALGATMWHMLVGEQPAPFDIPPLATVRNDVHPALAEVVDRACQDNVNRRYANARKMELALRQALQAMTGQAMDERTEALYLEEVPDIEYRSAPPVSARDFLMRAALASASLLLLMVVVYRVKQLSKRPQPLPSAVATATADPAGRPADPGGRQPHQPPLAPPPPLDVLPGSQVQVEPPPPGTFFATLPSGWSLVGYTGSLTSGCLRAPGGFAAGAVFRRQQPAPLLRLRVGVQRDTVCNFQIGLHRGPALLVGIVSQLQEGRYATFLQGGGRGSQPLARVWNTPGVQDLELSYGPSGWTLLEVASGQSVKLPLQDNQVDNIQLIVPGAQQEQVVRFPSFLLVEQ